MIKNILLAMIPIFVAVDAIGVLPIFITLTEGLKRKEKLKVILESILTATTIAVIFVFVGKAVLRLMGITLGDFMIAGGIVLFCLAILDIINPTKKRGMPHSDLGAVPIGTPLIVGPAVLTTSLIIIEEYGLLPTLISIFANVLLAGLIFMSSNFVIKKIGVSGTKALSKVMSLLLAAIAVMLIRKGLIAILYPK